MENLISPICPAAYLRGDNAVMRSRSLCLYGMYDEVNKWNLSLSPLFHLDTEQIMKVTQSQ